MALCAKCGEDNPDRARFCLACGAALASAEAPAREERKVVTVLFADLVGFTSRAEQLDPEEIRAVQSPYWNRLKTELERFGGTVEKFIGDAVMALFGAPVAHEDDPERAVRAALAIRDALTEEETGLQVRVAITTGEALVALGARPQEGEGMASGDVVNTAARLQAAAPANGVLVDETTFRATHQAIEYREAPSVEAKGKAEPISVWEAVAPRWRFGAEVGRRGGAELVGRREELDVLVDALSRARRERCSQLVTLVGVPGIGKSRLVSELFGAVESEEELIYWRQGRSLPYGEGATFWSLAEMVKAHAGVLETDTAEQADDKLRHAVAEVIADPVDDDWVTGHLRPLVGIAADEEVGADRRPEVFAAWRKFFEALAERRPLVLVFEDLQWADDGLLDFVDHLVEWASGVSLLCVCTARPELLERRPGWGGGKRNAVTISLSPLSHEDTARLVAALLEQAVLPADVQSTLLARAGGNPFYAEEYVRMLQDRAFLRRDGGTWRLERTAQLPLPESVQGIIAARLDALPPEEKDLIQDAAVLGKVIWVGALSEIVGVARWTIEERLHALERKEFMRREQRSSVASETEYAFRHILVRDVAYAQIPRSRRAEKHRRAAEWIESLTSDRPEDHAEMLAHHYLAALDYARAAGQETSGIAERARLALRDAGDRAFSLTALVPAARFYAGALALWPEGDPERPHLMLRLAQTRWNAGEEASELAVSARDELLAVGDNGGAAEAELLLTNLLWHEGRRDQAFAHLERAAALVEHEPPSRTKAYVLGQMSRFSMLAGDNDRAIEVGREVLAMAERLGLEEERSIALNTIGVVRTNSGDVGGVEDLEQAIAIAAGINSSEEVRGLVNLASVLYAFGDLSRTFALHERARRVSERLGSAVALRWLKAEEAQAHYWRGDWETMMRAADDFIAEAEAGSPHYMAGNAWMYRALVRSARGDSTGAAQDAENAVTHGRVVKDPQILYPTLAAAAYVMSLARRPERARQLADELLAVWRREGLAQPPSGGLCELAVFLRDAGRGGELADVLSGYRPATPWVEAALAIVAGEDARAADVYASIGAFPEEALARLRAAQNLASEGRRAEANAELERALAFYRRVGASAYARAGEKLLAASA